MSFTVELPAAQSDAVEHADWIELDAIRGSDRSSSYEDFASQIRISGTTDVMVVDDEDADAEDDEGGELSYRVADDVWSEIERRHRACGGDDGFYPFEVTRGSITLKDGAEDSSYVFQLLLSTFGKDAGPDGTFGERVFEHLSSHAGRAYLGGERNHAKAFRFGFPRPDHTNFTTALRNLCREIGSGCVKEDAALREDQKDSHLDVVVWRPFPDLRESQLIGFGQCAAAKAAREWEDKMMELQPANFVREWLADELWPEPVRMFFVPHCVHERRWRHVTIHAGLVFDRCRIAGLAGDVDGRLLDECRSWSSHVIDRMRGGRS